MVKAKFTTDGKDLFINGRKIIRGGESFSGWYWFAVEEVRKQDSVLADSQVAKDDTIFFGFVQGLEEESWGQAVILQIFFPSCI
jgi:hypothetical protein